MEIPDLSHKPNRIGAERLWKLSQFLYTVPPKRFDLREWVIGKGELTEDCDTVACALGWASTIFKEITVGSPCRNSVIRELEYNGEKEDGFSFACDFFDIHWKITDYFFDGDYYEKTDIPQLVAQRIENYVLLHYPEFKKEESCQKLANIALTK